MQCLCGLAITWPTTSGGSRSEVPTQGVVIDTTGKEGDGEAWDKCQSNANAKEYEMAERWIARIVEVIILLEIVQNLLSRKKVREKRLLLR